MAQLRFLRIRILLPLSILILLAGPWPAMAAAGRNVTIAIDNFTFKPATVTIMPGTTVTWVNHDDIPHTVVETGHLFRSPALDSDDTFSFTFDKEGDYDFFCSLHPRMTGKIIVKP